jgi:MFS family permease
MATEAVIAQLLREPRRPAAVRASSRARWFVVATVCIGAFMGQLDASIVTLALPHIGAALHAGAGTTRWVALAYLLALTGTLVAVGRLADRFGRKLLYLYGFAVFTAGSALCGLAGDLGWLIAARVLQGFGAALLQANSVALIATALRRGELARGIGVQGAAQASGLALGPVLGGLLLALGGWRLIFLVNLPAGVVGFALGWVLLPRSRPDALYASAAARDRRARADRPIAQDRPAPTPFDWPGAALLAGALGALMLLLSLAGSVLHSPTRALALALLTVGLFAALLRRERRASAPVLDLALLRRPALARGLTAAGAAYVVMFGALYVVPYYLAAAGVPVALAGAQLAALPLALGIAAPLAGRAAGWLHPRTLTAGGLALAGAGLLVLALEHDLAGRLSGLALAGAGLGAFVPVNNATVMGFAPRGGAGGLSGVLNTTRGVGTALGVALAGLLYGATVGSAGPATRAAGASAGEAAAGRGLTVTLLALAAVAGAAAGRARPAAVLARRALTSTSPASRLEASISRQAPAKSPAVRAVPTAAMSAAAPSAEPS